MNKTPFFQKPGTRSVMASVISILIGLFAGRPGDRLGRLDRLDRCRLEAQGLKSLLQLGILLVGEVVVVAFDSRDHLQPFGQR